ncbi:MAG: VWA domain-containing protein [Candidatus Hydrogenedentes bacterium]|nr:VWA domain-containing protein [Candidatus Hydrogenedentota bacterium]
MSGLFQNDWLAGLVSLRFSFPWALLLLLLLPWTIWLGKSIQSLAPTRKWTAIVLRSLILLCLIAALAGAELVKINDRLAVFFLLDRSNSIPEELRAEAENTVKTLSQAYMTEKDEAGVIAFGEEPSIELTVGPTLELKQVQSYVGGEQTDLAAAIRLALAAFPQGYMRRIVVLSDGNETRGSVLEEVKLARASGAAVDVVPIKLGGRGEVRIREVTAPSHVNADEPFKLQVVVEADQDSSATLRLYQRVREGVRMLQSAEVTLQKGDNAFLLPQELGASGFYEYEATVESAEDTIAANNEGRAFTIIHGEPTVLYLDADPMHSQYLLPALEAEGLAVVPVDFGTMPSNLAEFQNYDTVVLANVSATDLSTEQLNSLEAMVRDLGIGLVMIGGPDTFGPGGYYNSPVERAIPLSMDLKQRKVMPQGALVLILHTCEFQDGNAWARRIALASLDVLSSQDLMGALAYDWQAGESWLYTLQPVGNKELMRAALNTTQIGDMPDVQGTLQKAYDALASPECTASVKRVVIISDGDPAAPTAGLLKSLADASISVSTICINPHRSQDQDMLRWIAGSTGGNYYYVTDPSKLPQIFTKEAAVVKRASIIEEPFTPQVQYGSEILRGIVPESIPALRGYVATTPKENAIVSLISHQSDPVLAQWRYGLGKSVAFTSDITSRWAADWLSWDGFRRFWSQAVRWTLRETSPSNFHVESRVKDGKGYVKVDAVDDQGRFVNFLRPEGIVTGPAPEFARIPLDLQQTGPGIYEGTFPLDNPGVYMVNMTYTRPDGSQGMIPSGLAMNDSKEYEHNTTNLGLLQQAASVGGGTVRLPTDNPFEHNLTITPTITPVWPYLAAVAACAFPVEIFVRRVIVDFSLVWVWLAALLRKLPLIRKLMPEAKPRRVHVTGAYGAASIPSRTMLYSSSGLGMPGDTAIPQGILADAHTPEPEVEEAAAPAVKPQIDYTQQLLAAKERALEKRGRRKARTDDDNTSPRP